MKENKTKGPANWREHIKDTFASLKFFAWVWREFMNPRGRRLAYATLGALFAMSLLSMSWPYIMKLIVDALTARDIVSVVIWICIFGVVEAFEHLIDWRIDFLAEHLSAEQWQSRDVRLSEMFFGKSLGQHRGGSQDLSPANVKEGRNAVRSLEQTVIYRLVPTLVRATVLCGLLFWLHWLAGVAALAFVAYMVVWTVYLNRRVLTEGAEIDAELRSAECLMDERWRNVERVKSFGMEAEDCSRIRQAVLEAQVTATRFWTWYAGRAGIRAISSILPLWVGMTAFGSWLVLRGDWTVGSLMPLILWTGHFIGAVNQYREIERQMNGNLPAIRTLHRIMTLKPAVEDAPDALELASDKAVGLHFSKVSYSYPEKEGSGPRPAVLRDVSFSVEPGETVALIGPSGAGKSTIMHLALRSMDPQEGSVVVGGQSLTAVTQASWKRLLGYIPQGAPLFDGTIRELVIYGLMSEERKRVTDEDIWNLLQLLKADFGARLTDGLDTKIGRDGIELSGGERQRLSAAMALMKKPHFLLVDEATSNLDSETERAFRDGLNVLLGHNMSALIIAHRLSTVRDCEKFVVLKPVEECAEGEGQVEAIASSFEELYAVSSTFRRLADAQDLAIGPSGGPRASRVRPTEPLQT